MANSIFDSIKFGINITSVIASSTADNATYGPTVMSEDCWVTICYQTYNDDDNSPIIDGVRVSTMDRRINNSSNSWSWPLPVRKGQTLQIEGRNKGYKIYRAI